MSGGALPRVFRLELAGVVVFAFALLAFIAAAMHDSDYFWHLRAGQWIWEHGALPEGDPFSYTRPDAPWVLHEWLFELALYGVQTTLGDWGVRALVGILLGTTFALTFRSARNYLQAGAALAVTVPAFMVLLPHAAPRPQLLTFLLYAFCLNRILGYLRAGNPGKLVWLPAAMIVWVNGHAAYVIGLGLLAAVSLAVYVDQRRPGRTQRSAPLWPLLVCLVVALLATLLNPYHFAQWVFPFKVSGMQAMKLINEWAAPSMEWPGFRIVLGLALVYGWSLALRSAWPSLVELGLAAGTLLLAASAVRHLPFGALTLAPLLALSLGDGALARIRHGWEGTALGAWYRRAAKGGRELGSRAELLNWIFVAVLAMLGAAFLPRYDEFRLRLENEIVAWKAVDFVVANNITGRVLNEYASGGLLIQRRFPGEKVFIDGRTDFYGDAFIEEYVKIYGGKEGWEQAFDRYDIDYVICARDAPLRQLLLARGQFATAYVDERNTVLVRRLPRFEPLIRQASVKTTANFGND